MWGLHQGPFLEVRQHIVTETAHILHKTFLKSMVENVVERSPLEYSIVACLSALDSWFLVRHPETSEMRFQKLLSKITVASPIQHRRMW